MQGENIPYLARITAIADTFDAMTSRRPYRNALELEFVITEFEKCSGTQFDPNLAPVWIDILKNKFNEIKEIMDKYPAN